MGNFPLEINDKNIENMKFCNLISNNECLLKVI